MYFSARLKMTFLVVRSFFFVSALFFSSSIFAESLVLLFFKRVSGTGFEAPSFLAGAVVVLAAGAGAGTVSLAGAGAVVVLAGAGAAAFLAGPLAGAALEGADFACLTGASEALVLRMCYQIVQQFINNENCQLI